MIVIQIEIKQTAPNNVRMQACGGHVDGVATAGEVKAADSIIAALDPIFRSIGAYTELRPTRIITKEVPEEPRGDSKETR